jgi:tetratricopeptide (TPR) repeat protein
MKRRQFMERGLALFGAVTSAELKSDLPFRLLRALSRPGMVDQPTVDYLAERAAEQWKTWIGHTLRADVILSFTHDELHRVTGLLEGSLPSAVRDELTLVAGSLSMLAGVLHWDMRSYGHSRSYLRNAAIAADEGKDTTLGAVAHGWMSFAWSYGADDRRSTSEALDSVRIGRSLPGVRPRVQRWLAAIEAEVHASMGDAQACMEALAQADASALADAAYAADDYWTQYDPALFAGYKGACYLRLQRAPEAQQALNEALGLASTTRGRISGNLLADVARAYALDGRVAEACEMAHRAINANTASRSVAQLQRLDAAVSDLHQWADSSEVRQLAERIAAMREAIR